MEYIYRTTNKENSRFTIGFLDDSLNDDFQIQLMSGILQAARKYDVNIVRFGSFHTLTHYEDSGRIDMMLRHIKQYELDGLIFLGWSKAGPLFNRANFTALFGSIPLISIGTAFEDIPSLIFPGDKYFRELLLHLVNVHGCRKIAYVEPIVPDSRNEVYTDTMKEYGIYNPNLYIREQDLLCRNYKDRGRKAVSVIMSKRNVEFDAILSSNILETEALMNELKSRGLTIPTDCIVASCEDGEFGKYSSPGVTSIQFPWMELGYHSCEKMVELLNKGRIPLSTIVSGRIIYRGSCGCLPSSASMVSRSDSGITEKKLKDITGQEKKEIAEVMENAFPYSGICFYSLLDAFLKDYAQKSYHFYLKELTCQLQGVSFCNGLSDMENIVSFFRRLVMPYIMNEEDMLLWSGDMFQQAQVLLREKIARVTVYEKASEKILSHTLQETSRLLVTKFNKKDLFDALAESLPKLNIQGLYLFLFQKSRSIKPFDSCTLEFRYNDGSRVEPGDRRAFPAKDCIRQVLAGRDNGYTVFAHVLGSAGQYLGFVLFEPGPLGQGIYHFLSTCISTALSGSILLDNLDLTYKKLVEHAQREGMAEVATGIIHNIGNILNSVNASVHMLRDLASSSSFEDLMNANALLERNFSRLDDFMRTDEKARKLMEFYIKLGAPLAGIQEQFQYQINRLNEKVNSINEIIISQQSYAGVNTTIEELSLISVLEDVIRLHAASIEKYGIRITRDYKASPRVLFQKIKMFHLFANLVNNAIEAMADNLVQERLLTLIVYSDESGKYVEITDSGCGIPNNLIGRIFSGSFTTKKGRQGISLSSCTGIMGEMGGSLRAESEGPGKGSTFIIRFQ